jgi:hypothetical protein
MGFKVSGSKIAHAYIGSKLGRKIGAFLDGIPQERLTFCIQTGKFLTDYIPEEKKYEFKAGLAPYYDLISQFTPEETYGYIPQSHRSIIESITKGREWAIAQLEYIRDFLLAT